MEIRYAVVLWGCVSALGLGGCANRPAQEKSAADVMSSPSAASAGDVRACYDEFGYRRADAPYAFCSAQPQYYAAEPRRRSQAESVTVDATQGDGQDTTDAVAESATSVVRPTARTVPPVRPGIGVTRMPVPVPGGMRVLR